MYSNNEILLGNQKGMNYSYITTWMTVKLIMLSKKKTSIKSTYFMTPLYEVLGKVKLWYGANISIQVTPKDVVVSNDWEGVWGKFLMVIFCILTEVCITQLYVYVKTQPWNHLKFVHFVVYKFYIKRKRNLRQLLN